MALFNAVLLAVLSNTANAGVIKAKGVVATSTGAVQVEFVGYSKSSAVLVLRAGDHAKRETIPLRYPSDVLSLLADKRMQFMWPGLIEWAGPTLEPLRDRMIGQLRSAYATGVVLYPDSYPESDTSPHVHGMLELTDYLAAVGQDAEAEQILLDNLSRMPLSSNSRISEWAMVAQRIAAVRAFRGDLDGAIRQFAVVESTIGASDFAINATVSRAALLVESGRFNEGLAALDEATTRLKAWAPKSKNIVVPGSTAELVWIRACALKGLGREIEAETALKSLASQSEGMSSPSNRIPTRGLLCLHDIPKLKERVANSLQNDVLMESDLTLQHDYRLPARYSELWNAVRSDPEIKRLAADRIRTLPTEMSAALNRWRPKSE